MKPTGGRVVFYRLTETETRPAFVVRVLDDDMVNLVVFLDGDEGDGFMVHELDVGVARRLGVTRGSAVGEWEWPTMVAVPPPASMAPTQKGGEA